MKEITLDDCVSLREDFDNYLKSAEQHQFPILFIIDMKFKNQLSYYKTIGKIDNQSNANAMFRVVLKAMGKDFSEYKD